MVRKHFILNQTSSIHHAWFPIPVEGLKSPDLGNMIHVIISNEMKTIYFVIKI